MSSKAESRWDRITHQEVDMMEVYLKECEGWMVLQVVGRTEVNFKNLTD